MRDLSFTGSAMMKLTMVWGCSTILTIESESWILSTLFPGDVSFTFLQAVDGRYGVPRLLSLPA